VTRSPPAQGLLAGLVADLADLGLDLVHGQFECFLLRVQILVRPQLCQQLAAHGGFEPDLARG
jgi:hypothetical protein